MYSLITIAFKLAPGGAKPKLLLTDDMTRALFLLLDKVTCNPRGMKRIANLLQIVVALGRIKPRDKYISLLPIAQAEQQAWNKFTEKCVHWIFLCENFPFRMSAFVQILLDVEQKNKFNADDSDVTISYTRSVRVMDSDKIPDVDEMSVFDFYMIHVEKYIPAFTKAEKFGRNDRDPEEFACLLKRTAAKKDGQIFITCKDVLGKVVGTTRDAMLSLLSYSFNLDPARRIEVLNFSLA